MQSLSHDGVELFVVISCVAPMLKIDELAYTNGMRFNQERFLAA